MPPSVYALNAIPSTSLNRDDFVFLSSIFSSYSFYIYFWALSNLTTILWSYSSLVYSFYFKVCFYYSSSVISLRIYLCYAEDCLKKLLLFSLSLSFILSFSFYLYLYLSRYLSLYRSFWISSSILSSLSMSFLNYFYFCTYIFLKCSANCS